MFSLLIWTLDLAADSILGFILTFVFGFDFWFCFEFYFGFCFGQQKKNATHKTLSFRSGSQEKHNSSSPFHLLPRCYLLPLKAQKPSKIKAFLMGRTGIELLKSACFWLYYHVFSTYLCYLFRYPVKLRNPRKYFLLFLYCFAVPVVVSF